MAVSISRRSVLAAGAGAAVGLTLPGAAALAGGPSAIRVRFVLNAETLDGGEQVTSLTLATGKLGRIVPAGRRPAPSACTPRPPARFRSRPATRSSVSTTWTVR